MHQHLEFLFIIFVVVVELLYKSLSPLHSCYSEHIALIASIALFNYIVCYKYETKTHTGVFFPNLLNFRDI